MMFRSYSNISKYFLRDYGTIAMVIILVTMVTTTTVISSRANMGGDGHHWNNNFSNSNSTRANHARYSSVQVLFCVFCLLLPISFFLAIVFLIFC